MVTPNPQMIGEQGAGRHPEPKVSLNRLDPVPNILDPILWILVGCLIIGNTTCGVVCAFTILGIPERATDRLCCCASQHLPTSF